MAARQTVPRDLPPRSPTDGDVFIEGKSDSDVADSNSRNSDKTIEFNADYNPAPCQLLDGGGSFVPERWRSFRQRNRFKWDTMARRIVLDYRGYSLRIKSQLFLTVPPLCNCCFYRKCFLNITAVIFEDSGQIPMLCRSIVILLFQWHF